MKVCTKCGKSKPLVEFGRRRDAPDGLSYWCRDCKKELSQKNYQENRERRQAYGRRYHRANREKRLVYNRKYYRENREEQLAYSRKYHQKHREREVAYKRKHRRENREQILARERKWRRENPEKASMKDKARRAREKGAEGSHTLGEWELLKRQYGYTCPACGRKEPKIKLTEDHIIPLSRGGSDYIENIQPLCLSCNDRKHTKIIKYATKREKMKD